MTVDTLARPIIRPLDRLLRPGSIAIVGASDKPGALGALVLSNLERAKFAGDIHLINPKREEIGGRRCLKSVADLPDKVDVAVLAIPRAGVIDTVRALAARRVGAAIIFSAGFAEGGAEGLGEQQELAFIAKQSGMVMLGPNCLGMVNHSVGVPLTFAQSAMTPPAAGARGIGIVSQSGAMAAVLSTMLASRELGITVSVSTGNEAASGVEDYVEYLIDDPETHVIALIVEQFRQPRRFIAAVLRARQAGKLVVLLHPGKSSAARTSAATHTGAMAGDYQVMRVHVERAGVVMAETLEELGDITEVAARCPVLPSGGVAVLAESGAFKALTLDFCDELGLPLPELTDANAPALRAAMPDFVPVSNPLDLTAQGLIDPDLYYRTLAALFGDERFGAIATCIIQTEPVTCGIKFPPILRAMRELKPAKPMVFAGLDEGAPVPAGFIAELRSLNVPYFPTTERAFRALKRLADFTARDFAPADAKALPARLSGLTGVIAEYRAKEVSAPLGIPVPKGRFVQTLAEAALAADAIGYPVVLKAQSALLSHKSDAGGVILGLADARALEEGWQKLQENIERRCPGLALDGVLVERMGKPGVEFIIGARNDPEWGPIILAGLGGVTAEVLKDVRRLTPDLPVPAIVKELYLLKSAALLKGFRGASPLDVTAVAELIAVLGRLLLAEPSILELDLNPVTVYPDGEGVIVLDALMLMEPE